VIGDDEGVEDIIGVLTAVAAGADVVDAAVGVCRGAAVVVVVGAGVDVWSISTILQVPLLSNKFLMICNTM